MVDIDCPYFRTCNAPLCPLDAESLENGCWYPNETICKKHQYAWIKNQKKLTKRAKNIDRYFDLVMLKRDCIIASGIEGIDPDLPKLPQFEKWLKNHPQITKEKRMERQERGKALAAKFGFKRGSKTPQHNAKEGAK